MLIGHAFPDVNSSRINVPAWLLVLLAAESCRAWSVKSEGSLSPQLWTRTGTAVGPARESGRTVAG